MVLETFPEMSFKIRGIIVNVLFYMFFSILAEKNSMLHKVAHFLMQYILQTSLMAFEKRETYLNYQQLNVKGYGI